MDLSLQDAARLLGVAPETVQRWARQGRLGVTRPSGEFHVSLAELRAWAEEQGLSLREPTGTGGRALPPFRAALERGRILHEVAGSTRDEVLAALVLAAPLPAGGNRAALLEQLRAREALASTGLGDGIAIPHPRTPSDAFAPAALAVVGLLAREVDWHALDGRPVHTAVLLVSPNAQQHLRVLSRLAFLLREEPILAALQRREPAAGLRSLFDRSEPVDG
jgi:PTS system nitrogen regulatory IIA component